MIVRRMQKEDVSRVAEIEAKSFSQPWSEQAFLDACEDQAAVFLVAEDEEEVLGYAGMYVSFEEGEITNVAVNPVARRRGVGEAIILAMQEEASVLGVTRIVLEVRDHNEPAIGLYEKMQFSLVGIRKGFYDFPKEDARIMEWNQKA